MSEQIGSYQEHASAPGSDTVNETYIACESGTEVTPVPV